VSWNETNRCVWLRPERVRSRAYSGRVWIPGVTHPYASRRHGPRSRGPASSPDAATEFGPVGRRRPSALRRAPGRTRASGDRRWRRRQRALRDDRSRPPSRRTITAAHRRTPRLAARLRKPWMARGASSGCSRSVAMDELAVPAASTTSSYRNEPALIRTTPLQQSALGLLAKARALRGARDQPRTRRAGRWLVGPAWPPRLSAVQLPHRRVAIDGLDAIASALLPRHRHGRLDALARSRPTLEVQGGCSWNRRQCPAQAFRPGPRHALGAGRSSMPRKTATRLRDGWRRPAEGLEADAPSTETDRSSFDRASRTVRRGSA